MKSFEKKVALHLVIISAFAPLVTFAAPQDFAGVVSWVANFATLLVPFIIGLTFLYIIWGIAQAWIINGGNEESTQTGKTILLTGIIGLTVMVGMWGIVSLVRNAIFF
jgi:hypothetical protein